MSGAAASGAAEAAIGLDTRFEPFRERPPWWGGHLQTLRNQLRSNPTFSSPGRERLLLRLRDGDALVGTLDHPRPARPGALPIVLIHGLAGSETSIYVLDAAIHFLSAGHPVLRLNLRGAGPSRAHCRGWANAGSWQDLADAFAALPPVLVQGGFHAVAFSLGGNTLLDLLAEAPPPRLLSAATVSTPLDLAAAARVLMAPRSLLYDRYLLRGTRRGYLDGLAHLAPGLHDGLRAARSLVDLDDRVTAPLHGYETAWDYYAAASCYPRLPRITTPALLVHAADDPLAPAQPYREHAMGVGALTVLLTERGGHIGFHDRPGYWHLRQVERYVRAFEHG